MYHDIHPEQRKLHILPTATAKKKSVFNIIRSLVYFSFSITITLSGTNAISFPFFKQLSIVVKILDFFCFINEHRCNNLSKNFKPK